MHTLSLAETGDSGEGAWEAGDGERETHFSHHVPQFFPFEFCATDIFLTYAVFLNETE